VKKTALALTTIMLFSVSSLVGVASVKTVNANFIPSSQIWINSPINTTYTSNTLILNYSVFFVATQNKLVTYSLDGRANATLLNNQTLGDVSEEISGNIVLSDLSEGSHHLELYSENSLPGYAEVFFSIDTVAPTSTIYPSPTPIVDPYPIWLLSISYAAIAVVIVGSLFIVNKYFRGKKH